MKWTLLLLAINLTNTMYFETETNYEKVYRLGPYLLLFFHLSSTIDTIRYLTSTLTMCMQSPFDFITPSRTWTWPLLLVWWHGMKAVQRQQQRQTMMLVVVDGGEQQLKTKQKYYCCLLGKKVRNYKDVYNIGAKVSTFFPYAILSLLFFLFLFASHEKHDKIFHFSELKCIKDFIMSSGHDKDNNHSLLILILGFQSFRGKGFLHIFLTLSVGSCLTSNSCCLRMSVSF